MSPVKPSASSSRPSVLAAPKAPAAIQDLLAVMARLRDPENGCPWDLQQSFETIAPYTIEEAYEVADAIDRENMPDLCEELGDLLLQVVFHAQLAKEQGLFTFDDVVAAIVHKLIFRHPHVFGEEKALTTDDVMKIWATAKADEKEHKRQDLDASGGEVPDFRSVLDDVPLNLPSLMRMQKISKIAAKKGFEWENAEGLLDKIEEEIREFREALAAGKQDHIVEELGDVFFTLVQLGRWIDVDCEEVCRQSNVKFYNRFSGMERDIHASGEEMSSLSSARWEEHWQNQKRKEQKAP